MTRPFIKAQLILGASALAIGCAMNEEPSPSSPVSIQKPTAQSARTAAVEVPPSPLATPPPAPSPDEHGVFNYVLGGPIQPPELITKSDIDFTPFWGRTIKGSAAVAELVVQTDGTVTEVHLLKGLDPELDRLFLDALGNARFKPATLNGVPVPVKLIQVLRIEVQ